jgi:hypothetical protein
MKNSPEWLAFQQVFAVCRMHEAALRDALEDLDRRRLTAAGLENLSKEDRRLLDQFAYRYTRLQDDLGVKLIPAILRLLGEEIASLPMLDRLVRMEQLGWLPDAEEWADLRRVRNEFTHDYPDTLEMRFQRFELARASARRLLELFHTLREKTQERFPEINS